MLHGNIVQFKTGVQIKTSDSLFHVDNNIEYFDYDIWITIFNKYSDINPWWSLVYNFILDVIVCITK